MGGKALDASNATEEGGGKDNLSRRSKISKEEDRNRSIPHHGPSEKMKANILATKRRRTPGMGARIQELLLGKEV